MNTNRWARVTIVVILASLIAVSPVAPATPAASATQDIISMPRASTAGPLGHEQIAKLVADPPADGDHFGVSSAISGGIAVVGADGKDGDTGAVYIFARNHYGADKWGLLQIRTASGGASDDYFGHSVAISGDTMVVGAYGDESDTGAAYIFERNHDWQDSWTQVAELTALDGATGDKFGYSVGISGDTVVVGAYLDNGIGSAYVFSRNWGGTADAWGQVDKLIPSDGASNDYFGYAVSISGDTVAVGSRYEEGVVGVNRGAAYIFERNYGGVDDAWNQVRKLTAEDAQDSDYFGYSISISVDTVVVGAEGEDGYLGSNRGAAYVFERNQDGANIWGQVRKLTASDTQNSDYFGHSVAIDGDSVVVGAQGEDGDGGETNWGAAYVFERNEGGADSWGEVNKLSAADAADKDTFGMSVAISGRQIVVGAYREDGVSTDPAADRGAAYLFVDNSGGWQEIANPRASIPDDDSYFGHSVAVSGDTAVIGAYDEDGQRGAAHIFTRNQNGADGWGAVTKLTATVPEPGDHFGISVGISGDTVIVGADWKDDDEAGQGVAYIFERNQFDQDNWGPVIMLTASDAANSAHFGSSVDISGDTAVVGANQADSTDGAITMCGVAYVFERNRGGTANAWGQVAKLTAGDAQNWDNFGNSIAISGDTVVVGANWEDGFDGSSRGAAYVFVRNHGGPDNWGQLKKLTATLPQDGDYFGVSVAISGDTVVVGAHREDGASSDPDSDRGAAYVFERNQGGEDNWGQVSKLTASDPKDEDNFGQSVGISGGTIVVGAYREDGTGTDRGAAYVFEINQDGVNSWGQVSKLGAGGGANGDWFGESVSISGDTLVAGASHVDGGGHNQGAAYVFRWQLSHVYLPLVIR